MSTLLDEPLRQESASSAAQRLRTTMAAVRVSMQWFGTRKTLTREQRTEAADAFGAEGTFLSAGKKLIDTSHPSFKSVTAARGKIYNDGVTGDEGKISVYNVSGAFSKMETTTGDRGAFGTAAYNPDQKRWEIVAMETPGPFRGTLEADWDGNGNPTVRLKGTNTLGGYNVLQSNQGPTITAYSLSGTNGNWATGGRSGDLVFCMWDMAAGKYYIIAVQPNPQGWPTLDVVTRTSLEIDFANQTFTKHDFTRQIKIPPWVTIGDEVQR